MFGYASVTTAVTVRSGTTAKCSLPPSSKKIEIEVRFGEKLTKSRWGTSKIRPEAVSTRMYRNLGAMLEGWTKNLALLFPSPIRLALLRVTEFLLIAGGVAASVTATLRGHLKPAVAAAILAVTIYGFLLNRVRGAHFSWQANALSPAGLPLFAYLLLRSRLSHKKGSVRWKGRTYGSRTNQDGDAVIIKRPRPAERSSA